MRLAVFCVLSILLLLSAPVCAISSDDTSSYANDSSLVNSLEESAADDGTSLQVPAKKGFIRRIADLQTPGKENSGLAESDQNGSNTTEINSSEPTNALSASSTPLLPVSVALFLYMCSSLILLGILYVVGKGPSQRFEDAISPGRRVLLSGGYILAGCGFLGVSLLILTTFRDVDIRGIFFSIAGGISVLFLYLALSSVVLWYSLRRTQPFLLIHLLHPVLTAIAGALYSIVIIMMPRIRLLSPVWASFLLVTLSLVLSVAHYRLLSERIAEEYDRDAGAITMVPLVDTVVDDAATQDMHRHLREEYFPRSLQEKYVEIEYVGKGGIARVFKARRRRDGKIVAVKIPINSDETTGKVFLKEMQIWKSLHHPNIVEIHSVNILPVPYVEMEYIARSLADMDPPLSLEDARDTIGGIGEGLAYAHSKGIIHRDIKPHNILVDSLGVPLITDWGLGTSMDESHETNINGFSLSYAAPEQISPKKFGKTGVWTDIYQIGVLFYLLLTGHPPYGGESVGEMSEAIVYDLPAPPSNYRPEAAMYDAIVLKCLRKNPVERYSSVDAFLVDLTDVR